jgi:hypothetical protein
VGAQAGHGVVEVVDREHDLPEAERVRRGDRRRSRDQTRMAELRQLHPPVAVRGHHHGDVDSDAFESVEAVHPGPLDRHLALKRHAEGGEEGDGGPQVVDDDADVVHSRDCHVRPLSPAAIRSLSGARLGETCGPHGLWLATSGTLPGRGDAVAADSSRHGEPDGGGMVLPTAASTPCKQRVVLRKSHLYGIQYSRAG